MHAARVPSRCRHASICARTIPASAHLRVGHGHRRPGLLYDMARILAENTVELFGARIATLGERAEDTFTIGSDNLRTEAERLQLEKALLEIL